MPLSEEQCESVRQVLASPGWQQVMQPLYANRARIAIKTLALFQAERDGEFKDLSDDQLRSIIRECEWMTSVWKNEIAANDYNRQLAERENGHPPANP